MSQPYLNVQLESSDGLLQHLAPLLLRQLYAVHPAAVQLFEQVGAGDAGESEERDAVAAAQLQGLLGDPTQDLPSRQVPQVPGISVGNQVLRVLLPDLKKKKLSSVVILKKKKKKRTAQCAETHLFDAVTVSLSGCWDNNLLSPVSTKKELQVFLNERQSGQFSRKVNWRNAWMVAVSVQLLL